MLSWLFGSPSIKRVVTDLVGFPLEVVGESNYQNALSKIFHSPDVEVDSNSFDDDGLELESVLTLAVLVREPRNPYDKNAVAVTIKSSLVGYLKKDQAARVSGQMDSAKLKRFECKAKIIGPDIFGVFLKVPKFGEIEIF